MRRLWIRARAAVVMGLLWGAAGAAGGFAIELILNIVPGPDNWLGVDIWPAALALPAFVGGVIFSVLVAVAERRRKFEELSYPRFALWGAVTGAVIGYLVGLPDTSASALFLLAPMAVVGGASASVSLALARMGRTQGEIGASPESGRRLPQEQGKAGDPPARR